MSTGRRSHFEKIKTRGKEINDKRTSERVTADNSPHHHHHPQKKKNATEYVRLNNTFGNMRKLPKEERLYEKSLDVENNFRIEISQLRTIKIKVTAG